MLLPSDVARLVLGYLQQEKLLSTCKAFITESPHLKEYAEYHTDDGAIPGCLLSLFGNNLTTILNEYITLKAKENEAERPFMMSSLWKKLELTLSQIRTMQESAAFQTNQRARTKRGITDRILATPVAVSGSAVLHPVTQQISTPVLTTKYFLCPVNTPVTSQALSSLSVDRQPAVQSSNLTSISIVPTTQTVSVVPTQKKLPTTTATSSPMRRKQDTQRRRRVAPSSSSATERDQPLDTDGVQGIIDDDFPQLVIENAREKILSNKSLQEKLAENINKILACDSSSQTSKQSDGTAPEQDASIDEILGLQGGEIHMSEEAIHDILVQTELDPDFQELYDLFACVSSKAPKGNPRESSSQNVDSKPSGSEKSKNQDVVEDANSREQVENMDVSLRDSETEHSTLDSQCDAGTSLKDKADCSNNKSCVNEALVSGISPKFHEQSSDLVTSIESDGEMVIDSSKESNKTAIEVSLAEPQEVEIESVSLTDECCFIIEDDLPQTSVSPAKTGPTKVYSKESEAKELLEMSISEQATNKLSDPSKQEESKNLAASQQSTVSPQGSILVIAASSPALDCSNTTFEKQHQPAETSKSSPVTKLSDSEKNKQGNTMDFGAHTENVVDPQRPTLNVPPAECHGQASLGPEMGHYNTGISLPSNNQAVVDPNTIVTLNLIAIDPPGEAELHNAVNSIHEDNFQTIILSPLVKKQEAKRVGASSADIAEPLVVGEQSQLPPTSSECFINIPNGDCTVYAVSGTSSTADGSVLKLIPTSSSTFTPGNSLFISNVPAKQPNIVMLSNSSATNSSQKQGALFQTPPRPGSMYTVGQAISPKISQGSTIILASPVQPVLQGVMSMFPVSLVGQGGGTFTTQPHQLLHVPVPKPVAPKLPLPPKSQKPPAKPAVRTGKPLSFASAEFMSRASISVQRDNDDSNSTPEIPKSDERPLPETLNIVSKLPETSIVVSNLPETSTIVSKLPETSTVSKLPETLNVVSKLPGTLNVVSKLPETLNVVSKPVEAHRRVLCFDGSFASPTSKSSSPSHAKAQQNKNDIVQNTLASTEAVSSKELRKTESMSSSVTSSVDTTKDQSGEKRPTSLGGGHGVNKENVLKVGTPIHPAGQSEKRTLPTILRRTPQKKSSERVGTPSPLAKQASQLLQDMQFHSPNAKPRSTVDVPRTPGSRLEDKLTDNTPDHARTPTCRRYEDGGTPKPMLPPATPDLPTCSPASEAGSENSVNMAAHTLMILSRASLAKATDTTPLKDNTRQSKSSKSTAKKRRLEDSDEYERRSQRKELLSPSSLQKKKKMKKQRKKSSDNFPAEMDVDKFLMSLHYDE